MWEEDALARHAREPDVRQRREHLALGAHLGECGERSRGAGAVVRAVGREAQRAKPFARGVRRHAGERLTVAVERHQADDRQ